MSLSKVIYGSLPPNPLLPLLSESPRVVSLSEQNPFQESIEFKTEACAISVLSGLTASIISRNLMPFLMGFCECLPKAHAQQRIGNEFQVNTYTNNDQYDSSVASFSNGNFVVVWHSDGQDGSQRGIYGQLFDGNATTIGNEFQVNTYTTNDQAGPSGASLSNGKFVVTWSSAGQVGVGSRIFGQLFAVNGSKIGNEFQINTYIAEFQMEPSVTSLNNDNFVVTWTSNNQDGSAYGIFGQIFSGNGSKIGSEFQVNTYTFKTQYFSPVASFRNGNFVVTWQSDDQDGSSTGIFGQLFDENATQIGNEFQVNTYTDNSQGYSSVTSFTNGNFVVTWQSGGQDGNNWGVYGQLFDGNGTKLGSEFQVNTYTDNSQASSSVTSFTNGNFVVTWSSGGQDGSSNGVYGQLFDGNTTKIGSEFRANSYTTNWQSFPSVTSFSNGNFVVTWASFGQDGSRAGIYGQLFHAIPITSSTTTSTTSSTTSSTSTTCTSTTSTTAPTSSTHLTTLASPTSPTTSINTPYSRTSSTSPKTSSPKKTRLITWISLGVGGLLCFCVGPIGLFLLRKRKTQTGARFSEEIGVSAKSFELKPVVQRHKVIGEAYLQLSTLMREEAEEIYLQTGHLILFSETEEKFKYVIGSGQFGKIKVAQRIEDGQYVASKKVKGEENMRASEAEAQMQKAASGDNVLPIFNTIRLPTALYHFMPLAGLGDGIGIQKRLTLLNQSPLSLTILTCIAQNILTGLQTIHANGIYHLDIKPDNLVFTKDGTAYITDFGCAQRPSSLHLTGEALGDNRYFSPERLRACKEGIFDPEKADMWAAGMTLLQILYDEDPLQLFVLPSRLAARVERCDQAHFDVQLQRFSEVEKGSIWWVIKGLLDTNPKTRLSATQALQARCFQGLDPTQQERAFEELRKATLAQNQGIETSQVNLGDYGWVVKRAPETERGQGYRSEDHQQFYGYSMTPDVVHPDYQLTPESVTASSSSLRGYQLTP